MPDGKRNTVRYIRYTSDFNPSTEYIGMSPTSAGRLNLTSLQDEDSSSPLTSLAHPATHKSILHRVTNSPGRSILAAHWQERLFHLPRGTALAAIAL